MEASASDVLESLFYLRALKQDYCLSSLGGMLAYSNSIQIKILATGYNANSKLKMRTGGSTGKISGSQCHKTDEGDGVYWDIPKKEGKSSVRLLVKFRYRSPVIFEFHTSGNRHADAYAIV